VYDVDRDEAHHLSSSAAAVWRRCAEATTVEYVASGLVGFGDPMAITWEALAQLDAVHLLDTPIRTPDGKSIDRRKFLRNLAIASVALPVVTTIVAQTPASAACPPGAGGNQTPCCSGNSCGTGQTCRTALVGCTGPSAGTCSTGTSVCCTTANASGARINGAVCANNGDCCSNNCFTDPITSVKACAP
jgi:hypothetical protein